MSINVVSTQILNFIARLSKPINYSAQKVQQWLISIEYAEYRQKNSEFKRLQVNWCTALTEQAYNGSKFKLDKKFRI